MNHRLRQSLSLAMLTLTLVSAGAPVASALANTARLNDQASTVTDKPATDTSNNGNSTAKPTPTPAPAPTAPSKPKPPVASIDPSKMPTGIPTTFDVPAEPAIGEPGSRIKLSSSKLQNPKSSESNDNTRDLGGYVTADGKWKIKANRLLRSANLSGLSADDIKILQNHNVRHIIDMRTKGQVKSKTDKVIPGTYWENISILGEFAGAGLNTDANGDFVPNKNKPGDAGFYNHQLEFSASATTGYNKFLNGLLTQSGATLFHCSSGKDRTGIGSVLIMSALGMDTKTIAKDFMLSQTYNHHVQYSWLKEYYREINTYYTNMPNYLVNGLNFSKHQQEVLKSKYLVSNDKEERAYPAPKTPSVSVPSTPSTPAPVKPDNTKPVRPEASKPAKPAHKPTTKKKVVKVVSVKKIKKVQFVHLKRHRAYFYDIKLKHKVGFTKQSKTKWRLMKRAKLQINGKKVTYVQIKSPHGYHRWIQLNAVNQIKR